MWKYIGQTNKSMHEQNFAMLYVMNIHPVIPSYFIICTYILMYVMFEEFPQYLEFLRRR